TEDSTGRFRMVLSVSEHLNIGNEQPEFFGENSEKARDATSNAVRVGLEMVLPGNIEQATLNSFTSPGGAMLSLLRVLGALGFFGFFLFSCGVLAQSDPRLVSSPPAPQSPAPAGSRVAQTVNRELRPAARANTARPPTAATVAEAQVFMKKAEDQLQDLGVRAQRANWVQENFITDDTEVLSAQAQEKLTAVVTQLALEARRFNGLKMPPELARKFTLLKLSLTAPAPNNDAERKELTEIATWMDGAYGKGKYCKPETAGAAADGKQKCLSLNDLSRTLATSTNPDELLDAWVGWHKISPPMRKRYTRFVELSNKGAKELGFKDTSAMWRSNYDMTPEQFSAEVERLWRQVEPLYVSLHAYVRKQLIKKYGKIAERPDGMIPAHLLGNMWAQEWGNIYPL